MPYYDFKKKNILRNTLITHPQYVFDVTNGNIYLNRLSAITGAYVDNATMVPTGHVSLYELNIDRDSSAHTYDPEAGGGVKSLIFPFTVKNSSLNSMGTVTNATFNTSYQYGDTITGSYPLSASISRDRSAEGATRNYVSALKNTLNHYTYLSNNYSFSSSLGDKATQEVNLISIPSIFFDSGIKPGSVDLRFYISGTMVAQATDKNKNGELIQVDGTALAQTNGENLVAGVVLYNEGFVLLTGSWILTEGSYDFGPVTRQGRWCDFAAGANDGAGVDLTPSASFRLDFKGTNEISTIDMYATAPKGYLNHSSNPTYKLYSSASLLWGATASFGSSSYIESPDVPIKNTISSSFCDYSASFKKQTFISKIGIFDDQKKLIAVANLATPVKKTEDRALTFKLKLDI